MKRITFQISVFKSFKRTQKRNPFLFLLFFSRINTEKKSLTILFTLKITLLLFLITFKSFYSWNGELNFNESLELELDHFSKSY